MYIYTYVNLCSFIHVLSVYKYKHTCTYICTYIYLSVLLWVLSSTGNTLTTSTISSIRSLSNINSISNIRSISVISSIISISSRTFSSRCWSCLLRASLEQTFGCGATTVPNTSAIRVLSRAVHLPAVLRGWGPHLSEDTPESTLCCLIPPPFLSFSNTRLFSLVRTVAAMDFITLGSGLYVGNTLKKIKPFFRQEQLGSIQVSSTLFANVTALFWLTDTWLTSGSC